MLHAPALFILLAALVASPGAASDATASLPFQTISRTLYSRVSQAKTVVIRTQADWFVLWKQHVPERHPAESSPPLDFRKYMVVGVFLGTRASGCYDVAVSRVFSKGDAVLVEYRETVPAPLTPCPAVMTAPAHIVSVPATSSPVFFVRKAP